MKSIKKRVSPKRKKSRSVKRKKRSVKRKSIKRKMRKNDGMDREEENRLNYFEKDRLRLKQYKKLKNSFTLETVKEYITNIGFDTYPEINLLQFALKINNIQVIEYLLTLDDESISNYITEFNYETEFTTITPILLTHDPNLQKRMFAKLVKEDKIKLFYNIIGNYNTCSKIYGKKSLKKVLEMFIFDNPSIIESYSSDSGFHLILKHNYCDYVLTCFDVSALMVAYTAYEDQNELKSFFLEKGSDVNFTSDLGETCLFLSFAEHDVECIQLLLEKKPKMVLSEFLKYLKMENLSHKCPEKCCDYSSYSPYFRQHTEHFKRTDLLDKILPFLTKEDLNRDSIIGGLIEYEIGNGITDHRLTRKLIENGANFTDKDIEQIKDKTIRKEFNQLQLNSDAKEFEKENLKTINDKQKLKAKLINKSKVEKQRQLALRKELEIAKTLEKEETRKNEEKQQLLLKKEAEMRIFENTLEEKIKSKKAVSTPIYGDLVICCFSKKKGNDFFQKDVALHGLWINVGLKITLNTGVVDNIQHIILQEKNSKRSCFPRIDTYLKGHEWSAHGKEYYGNPDDYFRESCELAKELIFLLDIYTNQYKEDSEINEDNPEFQNCINEINNKISALNLDNTPLYRSPLSKSEDVGRNFVVYEIKFKVIGYQIKNEATGLYEYDWKFLTKVL